MKNIILAWLNANATNEQKALEIEWQCEKFAMNFAEWYSNVKSDKYNYHTKGDYLLKEFKEQSNEYR
jgi:hypothetical protein